jgi:hypothetical protein
MTVAQLMMLTGIGLVGLGGLLHYPALPYLKREFRSAGNYGRFWRPSRYETQGRRFIEAARLAQGTGLLLLLLSLFV